LACTPFPQIQSHLPLQHRRFAVKGPRAQASRAPRDTQARAAHVARRASLARCVSHGVTTFPRPVRTIGLSRAGGAGPTLCACRRCPGNGPLFAGMSGTLPARHRRHAAVPVREQRSRRRDASTLRRKYDVATSRRGQVIYNKQILSGVARRGPFLITGWESPTLLGGPEKRLLWTT
jgi:hypothetical protein